MAAACTFEAVCGSYPEAVESQSFLLDSWYYCMAENTELPGNYYTVWSEPCTLCTTQSSVGVRYLKFFEISQDPGQVSADSALAGTVVSAFTAFDSLPMTCDAGCVHTGYPDPEDPNGVFYIDPPQPGPVWSLYRGFMFDRTNTTCTGPGDAGTLSQETVGRSELSQGGGDSPGGGTSINESGTPSGTGSYDGAQQAQGLFDTMSGWLSSSDFVPTIPWSFEWDLPATTCTDPEISWRGQSASWRVCDHPATDGFRLLWAWAFAMLAAFRIWSLALAANN